jgi:hypothetical protein
LIRRKGNVLTVLRFRFAVTAMQVTLLLLFLLRNDLAGQTTTDYSTQIANADLSELWVSQRLLIIEEENKERFIPRSEPLGFIGNNYQRFYIHFVTAKRSTTNHLQYLVTGKTKVRSNVCDFKGTITIKEARLAPDPELPEYRTGYIAGEYWIEEDRKQRGSGSFKGNFRSYWFITNDGKIKYDTVLIAADGFCNNQFTGSWTSYATGKSEKCNWGDYRIPDSGYLDVGAGEFAVADEYVKNGWETYIQAFNADNPDSSQSKRAQAIEAAKWWR